MPEETGRIRISSERGGTVAEVTRFLLDLEGAYLALYEFEQLLIPRRVLRRFPPEIWLELGYPFHLPWQGRATRAIQDSLPPRLRLTIESVRVESPGFWEFVAALNPLQQIREYLNDRHKRRQDREFREASEKEKLILENELLRRQIIEKDNANLRERLTILREYRDFGFDDDDLERLIWARIGTPLSRLGRHQDTRLIGGAE